mgnify:CR=1 FL=1
MSREALLPRAEAQAEASRAHAEASRAAEIAEMPIVAWAHGPKILRVAVALNACILLEGPMRSSVNP